MLNVRMDSERIALQALVRVMLGFNMLNVRMDSESSYNRTFNCTQISFNMRNVRINSESAPAARQHPVRINSENFSFFDGLSRKKF